jgi:hypothetical protein
MLSDDSASQIRSRAAWFTDPSGNVCCGRRDHDILEVMGRPNYLVEGLSGTGKTSVCDELQRRGFHPVPAAASSPIVAIL